MARSRIDTSLQRTVHAGFSFPLGVYPTEEFTPTQGYSARFEPADGDEDEGGWEEWPDRYSFEVCITCERLESLCRSLFALMPGRVYPILDVLGVDAYREVDPYIAYDLVGFDRFYDAVRRHRGWFFEDGLVGFGAMSLEPFVYVFIDEHKVLTIRVQPDLKDRVEKILQAFDLGAAPEVKCVDSVVHEHRSVLECPPDRPDLLSSEEIVEELMDEWRLRLNVERERNLDDEGAELGVTGWRCLVRMLPDDDGPPEYAEMILTASSLDEAERLSIGEAAAEMDAGDGTLSGEVRPAPADGAWRAGKLDVDSPMVREADEDSWPELALIAADRVTRDELDQLLEETGVPKDRAARAASDRRVLAVRWLEA
jgi:hypothetical protein